MYRSIKNYKGQNANNLVKLNDATTGCCGDSETPCTYNVIIPTANAVNNIIFKQADGTTVTRTFSPAVTGAANVVAAIKAAILPTDGFEGDDDAVREVTYTTSGTNTIYHITGDLVVTSMLHNTSTTVSATARCTRSQFCTWFYAWPGDAGSTTFTIAGEDDTLGSFTLGGSTAAQVQAGIVALANWPANAYINVVETGTAFEISIESAWDSSPVLDGEDFEKSNCRPVYVP